MEWIRAFVAVPMTREVRDLIMQVEDELRRVGADVKWVAPENLHVTLKFLGNIDPEIVHPLTRALADALTGTAAFDIVLEGAGTFPRGRRAPRVVWVGMKDGCDLLAGVAGSVEDACASVGLAREDRPFRSHLTVGRVRRGSPCLLELSDAVAGVEFKPLKLDVEKVNLVSSRLSPKGPTYKVLESFALEHS